MKVFLTYFLALLLSSYLFGQWHKNMDLYTEANTITYYDSTIYLGIRGDILTSKDEGLTWNKYAEFNSQSINKIVINNNMQFVSLTRGGYGFDPIRFNLFRSFDYGKTWDSLYAKFDSIYYSSGGISNITLYDGNLYCLITARLLKSTDLGSTWNSDPYFKIKTHPNSPIGIKSTNKHLVVSFTQDSLYILKKGSNNWNSIGKDLPKDSYYNIEGVGDTLIVGGSYHNLFVSYNAGNNWEKINNNFPDSLPIYGIHLFGSQIYLTADNNRVFVGTLGKFIWQEISDGLEKLDFKFIFDLTKTKKKLFLVCYKSIYERDILSSIAGKSDFSEINSNYNIDIYPNPFNNAAKINIDIPGRDNITLELYNILGQKIHTLVENKFVDRKIIAEVDGAELASGYYFLLLKTNNVCVSKKLILLK